jgi:PAS domain S-box-containing protein
VESSDDAIVTKDLQGAIRSWNAGAERIFEYSASEVLGRPVTLLIPPEQQHEEAAILERIRMSLRWTPDWGHNMV